MSLNKRKLGEAKTYVDPESGETRESEEVDAEDPEYGPDLPPEMQEVDLTKDDEDDKEVSHDLSEELMTAAQEDAWMIQTLEKEVMHKERYIRQLRDQVAYYKQLANKIQYQPATTVKFNTNKVDRDSMRRFEDYANAVLASKVRKFAEERGLMPQVDEKTYRSWPHKKRKVYDETYKPKFLRANWKAKPIEWLPNIPANQRSFSGYKRNPYQDFFGAMSDKYLDYKRREELYKYWKKKSY